MKADKALERIGHDAENTANRAPATANAPVVVANSAALGAAGYMPYHHVPSPTPSGKAAIAACCASMLATTHRA